MRPSAENRAPGIYQSFDAVAPPPISIANTRIAGFVGITQKGPMNEATRLSNWDEFVEIFGVLGESYTAESVHGFFKNGGTDCWVVRVAHCAPKGALPGLEHASCADHTQIDDWNKPSLKIRALNEGTWGNQIWFRCEHTVGARTPLEDRIEKASERVDDIRRGQLAAVVEEHAVPQAGDVRDWIGMLDRLGQLRHDTQLIVDVN